MHIKQIFINNWKGRQRHFPGDSRQIWDKQKAQVNAVLYIFYWEIHFCRFAIENWSESVTEQQRKYIFPLSQKKKKWLKRIKFHNKKKTKHFNNIHKGTTVYKSKTFVYKCGSEQLSHSEIQWKLSHIPTASLLRKYSADHIHHNHVSEGQLCENQHNEWILMRGRDASLGNWDWIRIFFNVCGQKRESEGRVNANSVDISYQSFWNARQAFFKGRPLEAKPRIDGLLGQFPRVLASGSQQIQCSLEAPIHHPSFSFSLWINATDFCREERSGILGS